MPKVLIICDVYPPSFAPRMGYLVKYMKEYGWEADIVTRKLGSDRSFQSLVGSERVLRVAESIPSKKNRIALLIQLINRKRHYQATVNAMVKTIFTQLHAEDYALILCSTAHRTYILEVAATVAEKWKKKWIADIRDLDEQVPKSESKDKRFLMKYVTDLQQKKHDYFIRRRNRCLSLADKAISISPWHVDVIKQYNQHTQLIYNGFDPETYYPLQVKMQSEFKVIYTGTVHEGRHDPKLLFEAVHLLSCEKKINPDEFLIDFYVPKNWRRNITNAPSYEKVKKYVHFFDYVDTSEVPTLLNSASVLLLLSNLFSSEGPKGLISTTKYFEYLAVERPILCVRSDEHLLEKSINMAQAGMSARSVEETYTFILEKYNEWKQKGYTTVHLNREYVDQFSRKKQAQQFVQIIENSLSS